MSLVAAYHQMMSTSSHPPARHPPFAPPAGSQFFLGEGDVQLYSAISGGPSDRVVWFVLGPEAAAAPPYPRLTSALHEVGFSTALLHLRGTGFSEGLRGDIDDYGQVLSDNRRFLDHLATRFSRIFLLGHSAGAALALEAAADASAELAGIVLVNPAWRLTYAKGMGPSLGEYFKFAKDALFRRSMPTVDMNRSPDAIAFAPDREEAHALQRDPVVVRYFSLRYLSAQRQVMNRCPRNIAAVAAPVLLVQGAHDALVDPTSIIDLLEMARAADKHKLVAPEGGHGSSAIETVVAPLLEWFVGHAA